MLNSSTEQLTEWGRFFLEPANATHRQYEALRAYFVEGVTNKEAAKRFGYSEGSFRVLVHQFRQSPNRQFFLPPSKGPHMAPKKDKVRNHVIALRKQNLSIYDISDVLATKGHQLSPVGVSYIGSSKANIDITY
jgi:transposase